MSQLKTILKCVNCGYTIRNPKNRKKTCPKCGGTLTPKTIKTRGRGRGGDTRQAKPISP